MMNKAINLSSEALEMVNSLCNPSNLEDTIGTLNAAEEALQKQAYTENDPIEGNDLFIVAYQVKLFTKDLIKLKTLIEDERGNE